MPRVSESQAMEVEEREGVSGKLFEQNFLKRIKVSLFVFYWNLDLFFVALP